MLTTKVRQRSWCDDIFHKKTRTASKGRATTVYQLPEASRMPSLVPSQSASYSSPRLRQLRDCRTHRDAVIGSVEAFCSFTTAGCRTECLKRSFPAHTRTRTHECTYTHTLSLSLCYFLPICVCQSCLQPTPRLLLHSFLVRSFPRTPAPSLLVPLPPSTSTQLANLISHSSFKRQELRAHAWTPMHGCTRRQS